MNHPNPFFHCKKIEKVGDTSFLDWAIRKVMNDSGKIEHEVSLHLLELGIKLYCRKSGDLVLNFPYPKVHFDVNLHFLRSF